MHNIPIMPEKKLKLLYLKSSMKYIQNAVIQKIYKRGGAFMLDFMKPENKYAGIEKKLKKASASNTPAAIASIFGDGFIYFFRVKRYDLLSNFVLSHLSEIQDAASLSGKMKREDIKQSVSALEVSGYDASALCICDHFGLKEDAIELLAKRGRANDIAIRIAKEQHLDKGILGTAVAHWEKYNGDIAKSPAMTEAVKSIGKFSPEYLPDNPRVKEIIGQLKEAAFLYEQGKDIKNAARCYETIEMYSEACTLYAGINDYEGVSRTAEALGDLEKALEFVVKPERKISLLIRLERFTQAREYAAGMQNPEKYFSLIREKAKARMIAKAKSHHFIEAMELADIAECGLPEKNEILMSGRKYFDQQLTSASSDEEIRAIYKNRVVLEEKAGKFEEAGIIAEEVLKDLELASLLYEKANLFNRAILAASESGEKQKDEHGAKIRLAELHEKGGNLLSAAQLYEQAARFDKAYVLYEKLENFQKATECYGKTVDPDRNIIADLYVKAGEYGKAIDIYLKSDTFSDLEKAMSIAQAHHLSTHIREIGDAISRYLTGTEADLKKCFAVSKEAIASSYSPVLGIDFGTTNSTVAIFNKKTKKVEVVPIPGIANSYCEPSYFGVDESNKPIFGEKARLRSLTSPECVAARTKRAIGGGGSFAIGNKKYKSEEIAARIIRKMKSNAEDYLKYQIEARFRKLLKENNFRFPEEKIIEFLNKQDFISITNVVLTVPAFYNNNQKRATRDSAEIAGLQVLRLLHEPTAAALAYGYQKTYAGTLAVVDLGGGTLDISILGVGDGVYEITNISGDTKLGGSDIDTELVRYAIADIRKTLNIDISETDHPVEISRLRDGCENMKINLSSLDAYTMELPYFLNKSQYTLTLTRKELENISRPFLLRIKNTIEKAIKEHGAAIDHFLLVGNATKMPAVIETVKSVIRAGQLTGIDPGTVVASGAALEGALLSGDVKEALLLDLVPYSLGISVIKKDSKTGEEEMSRLIERNTTIPTKRFQEYTTVKDNQTGVNIRIYQGESYELGQNYFLGNFHLDGIPPSTAGTPKIEVMFEIGADCILTVSAEDKTTKRKQSIRIDGAVTLSPDEKAGLQKHFAESENLLAEKRIEEATTEINRLLDASDKTARAVEQEIRNFSELFHEKVEINARLYNATTEQVRVIQDMFSQRDQFTYTLQRYKDEAATTEKNLRQVLSKHLDFSDKDIVLKLQERLAILTGFKESLLRTTDSIEKNLLYVLDEWIQVLNAMEPDIDRMSPEKAANSYLVAGRYTEAKEILESMAAGPDGLTEEAFLLLLKCYVRMCLRDEYRDAHIKHGNVFKMIYPDFNRLDAFLRNVDDSVYMIQAESPQKVLTGSGFSLAPHLIVTNRHVVEGAIPRNIRVFGKNKVLMVTGMEVDPVNDLAILQVDETLIPFRLGEFNFVAPGERVLALGFPSPSSNVHSENIYISRGIVNSIRKIDLSPERVIFIDAKIGKGMSGGPLINDLGEVIGIITLIRYEVEQSDTGIFTAENQPVALPIHLVRSYLIKYKVDHS